MRCVVSSLSSNAFLIVLNTLLACTRHGLHQHVALLDTGTASLFEGSYEDIETTCKQELPDIIISQAEFSLGLFDEKRLCGSLQTM